MTEGAINKVLYNVDQRANTTDAEKKTARDNIGAIGAEDIPEIVDDRYKLLQYPVDQTYASYAVIDRFEQDAQGVAKIHCSYLTVATDSADGLMSASDKAKLNTVAYNAEQNVQADWNETDPSSDAYIRNKPSQSVQVQADWNEANTTLPSFIRNKPTIPSGNQLLPSATSADADKVLAVDNNGNPEWRDAGEGLMAVAHDNTLTGDGTNGSPLSVNTNNIQEKLVPGTGITITGNTISAAAALTAGNGVQIVNDVVSARVDGTSIDFDQAGNLSVKSPLVLNGQGTQTVIGSNGVSAENTTTHASTAVTPNGVTLSDGTTSDTFGLDDLQKLNGIQSGAEANVQSDWNQSNSSADDYIKNKPDLSSFATKNELDDGLYTKQDTLTPGTGITITNNVISATVDPQVQADWAQSDSSAVDFIKNKPQNLVQDANYVHTDNNFTNTDKSKLENIQSGAEVNVQANWNETDSTSDSYIQNKPANIVQDANYVHTDNNFTSSEKTKLTGIQAGAEQNVQSDWDQTDTSADDFIKNKPTIPVVPPLKELVVGSGVTMVESEYAVTISTSAGTVVDAKYVHTDNNFSNEYRNKLRDIEEGAEVNVQADWNATNPSHDAYIKNKPSIPSKTSDLTNDSGFITASQVPAQVNADWNASSGAAEILNKPSIPELSWQQETQGASQSYPADQLKIHQDFYTVTMHTTGGSDVQLGYLAPAMTSTQSQDMVLTIGAGSDVPGWSPLPQVASGILKHNNAELYFHHSGDGDVYHVRNVKNNAMNHVVVLSHSGDICSLTIEAPALGTDEEQNYYVVFDCYASSGSCVVDVENASPRLLTNIELNTSSTYLKTNLANRASDAVTPEAIVKDSSGDNKYLRIDSASYYGGVTEKTTLAGPLVLTGATLANSTMTNTSVGFSGSPTYMIHVIGGMWELYSF